MRLRGTGRARGRPDVRKELNDDQEESEDGDSRPTSCAPPAVGIEGHDENEVQEECEETDSASSRKVRDACSDRFLSAPAANRTTIGWSLAWGQKRHVQLLTYL